MCYRLWDEAATVSLPAFAAPEMLAADLSGLALDLRSWGLDDPNKLAWLDSAAGSGLEGGRRAAARARRARRDGRAHRHGPRDPRSAARAAPRPHDPRGSAPWRGGSAPPISLCCSPSAGSGQRPAISPSASIVSAPTMRAARAMRSGSRPAGRRGRKPPPREAEADLSDGALIAMAYPDRIAKARGAGGEFLMANGRAAAVQPHDRLARAPFLAIAEITGRAAQARILAACALTAEEVERIGADRIETRDETIFIRRARACGGGALEGSARSASPSRISRWRPARTMPPFSPARRRPRNFPSALEQAQAQLRDRIAFLRRAESDESWPDVSDEGLAKNVEDWLAPFIAGRASVAAITADDLDAALAALLPYALTRRLDRRRRRFSRRPPARAMHSTIRPPMARCCRRACRSCSASRRIRRSPRAAFP